MSSRFLLLAKEHRRIWLARTATRLKGVVDRRLVHQFAVSGRERDGNKCREQLQNESMNVSERKLQQEFASETTSEQHTYH